MMGFALTFNGKYANIRGFSLQVIEDTTIEATGLRCDGEKWFKTQWLMTKIHAKFLWVVFSCYLIGVKGCREND
jgi:hypothetical protein